MAVVSMLRMEGDPEELWAKLQEHVEPVAERLAPAMAACSTSSRATPKGF